MTKHHNRQEAYTAEDHQVNVVNVVKLIIPLYKNCAVVTQKFQNH